MRKGKVRRYQRRLQKLLRQSYQTRDKAFKINDESRKVFERLEQHYREIGALPASEN